MLAPQSPSCVAIHSHLPCRMCSIGGQCLNEPAESVRQVLAIGSSMIAGYVIIPSADCQEVSVQLLAR